eukprot:3068816-Pleurochrysis_carterae.AAC.2
MAKVRKGPSFGVDIVVGQTLRSDWIHRSSKHSSVHLKTLQICCQVHTTAVEHAPRSKARSQRARRGSYSAKSATRCNLSTNIDIDDTAANVSCVPDNPDNLAEFSPNSSSLADLAECTEDASCTNAVVVPTDCRYWWRTVVTHRNLRRVALPKESAMGSTVSHTSPGTNVSRDTVEIQGNVPRTIVRKKPVCMSVKMHTARMRAGVRSGASGHSKRSGLRAWQALCAFELPQSQDVGACVGARVLERVGA